MKQASFVRSAIRRNRFGRVHAFPAALQPSRAPDARLGAVGVWAQVRNDVAHDGEWQSPTPNESSLHAATRAAIISTGHDGTFASGTGPSVKRMRDYV